MAGMVPFTNNYSDHSTREGYQFEFNCMRCGNGYSSSFQHSVTGFGGRLLRIGGDLLGGDIGNKASQIGWDAQWMRDGVRGSTRDKALAKAAEEMQVHFTQCHRCGQWVCQQVCWNHERGLCTSCAPRLDQEIAGMQAAAQVNQLHEQINQVNWTQGVNYRDQAVGRCPSCMNETGGGKFCQHCGTPLAAAPAQQKKFCGNCGTPASPGAMFCAECGQSTA
ncbi:zinc ribbon domain-containing protein [Dactylosporangium sp. NPDC000244]|uniref:zinc ribbon domain-containing protein n=1 Tax=Dactylosporangium sp. NPDC000244 TaxID=3154365 RepID=UPI003319075D